MMQITGEPTLETAVNTEKRIYAFRTKRSKKHCAAFARDFDKQDCFWYYSEIGCHGLFDGEQVRRIIREWLKAGLFIECEP